MREFKFRIWDIENKMWMTKYFYPDQDYYAWINNKVVRFLVSLDWIIDHPKFWTIQQFTGLFDKNGREIYEGDIIRRMYGMNQKYIKNAEIMFGECPEDNEDDGNFIGWYINYLGNNWGKASLYDEKDYIEVIGNIFENPELLK